MESNIFVVDKDEITVHWKVTAETLPELVASTNTLIDALKIAGFKPDPSKAARKGGGWKEAKPETPAPDAQVPQHCGEPMRYVKFTDKQGTEREKYECRKGKACPQGNNFGGFTKWRDAWLKEMPPAEASGVRDIDPEMASLLSTAR